MVCELLPLELLIYCTLDILYILKNCKEHGNYLIAGVSTDELSKKKRKETAQN